MDENLNSTVGIPFNAPSYPVIFFFLRSQSGQAYVEYTVYGFDLSGTVREVHSDAAEMTAKRYTALQKNSLKRLKFGDRKVITF